MTAESVPARVSDEDRLRFTRQASALRPEESDDEGSLEWRTKVTEEADRFRTRRQLPPLKTEPELHRYARALGLIRG